MGPSPFLGRGIDRHQAEVAGAALLADLLDLVLALAEVDEHPARIERAQKRTHTFRTRF